MNIAFFGTSDRSIPLLEALKKSDFDLVLCVTKEDTLVGRKQESRSTAVKVWSETNRVQCLTINKFSPESTAQIKNLFSTLNIEMCVMADFSFIVPEEILEIPKHKFVNIHFSLLPSYRGASPVQSSILNGDKETGVTYLIATKGMDEGPIIHQVPYQLSQTETSGELYKILFEIAAQELPQVLEKYIAGKLIPQEQNHAEASYSYSPSHPKRTFIFKEDAKIDWNKTAAQIERAIRAYNPWPIAWTTLGDLNSHYHAIKPGKDLTLKVKIYEAKLENGELKIEKIQVEGKSILTWKEFENGYVA